MKSTRIFKNPHKVFCDAYNCRNNASHFIGRPDAMHGGDLVYRICDECLTAILQNLDDDLLEKVRLPQDAQEGTHGQEAPTGVNTLPIEEVTVNQVVNQLKYDLESKTVPELKDLAKKLNVKKYYDMDKAGLVEALLNVAEESEE